MVNSLGQDDKEGCATIGMHCVQIQNADVPEALQAVSTMRHPFCRERLIIFRIASNSVVRRRPRALLLLSCVYYLINLIYGTNIVLSL